MMMAKKYLPLIYIVLLCAATMTAMITPTNSSTSKAEVQVIPNEAIRLRILANSNKESDQELKRAIRDEVNKEINTWVAELTSIEEARQVIQSHLTDVEVIAQEVMERENNVQTIQVDFGETVFPTKLYGQYLYPAGKYEAIKITLGEGEGENWWCVLFPPLCFLDFNSGTAVSENPSSEGTVAAAEQSTNRTSERAVEETKVEQEQAEHIRVEEEQPQTEVEKTQSNEKTMQPIEVASQTNRSAEQTDDQEPENKYENNQPKNEIEQEINPPVYEDQDEEPVKVKFFLVELIKDLF